MENKYVFKLNEMVNEINKLNSIDEKKEAIYHLTSYASFIYYSGKITEKEFDLVIDKLIDNPWEKAYANDRDMVIDELFNSNILLGKYYKNHMLIYNNNGFIPKEANYSFKIRIYKEFREFLKYMNCDKLFSHLLRNHKISFNSIYIN